MSWFSKKSVWIQDKDRDLHNRFYSSLEFIRKFKPFLLIFNGDIWHRLLARENFISNADKVGVTDKFNLYFFETLGIRSVLFDKFFSRHFWVLTDNDRSIVIPNLIRQKYVKFEF